MLLLASITFHTVVFVLIYLQSRQPWFAVCAWHHLMTQSLTSTRAATKILLMLVAVGFIPSGVGIFSSILTKTCTGDYLLDSSGECGVPVAQRFNSPANGNGIFWLVFLALRPYSKQRYSFDVASVHVVQFSTGWEVINVDFE